MQVKKICALYFSATGNTRKVTETMAETLSELLGCPWEKVDFTPPEGRSSEMNFGADTLLVAGFPTYAGKLPNKILPDVQTKIRGEGTPAVAIVTYGNRSFDNSLAELSHVLAENGFSVTAGAALPCRHAFSDLLAPGRPDEADLEEIKAFSRRVKDKLLQEDGAASLPEAEIPGDAAAPYYVPKGTDGQPAKFLKAKPKTDPEKCDRCGICVKLCPVGSIDPDDVFNVPGICIKCQACVRGCPKGAKYLDDPAFLSHVAMLEQNFTERKEALFVL